MDLSFLFKTPIFNQIPENQREALLNQIPYQVRKYQKGEWIANQNDDILSLYILIKGKVKTEMISDGGVCLHMEVIQAPVPLAAAFLYAETNRFPVDVAALEACEVFMIPKAEVSRLLSQNEAFLNGFLAFNANRSQFLSERIKIFSQRSIKGKLAYYILKRAKKGQFTLGRSLTELAEYFGVARPSLSRCLSEMISEGILSFHEKEGIILNLKKLEAALLS